METVTRNASRKTKKQKPIVDVPRAEGTGHQITDFMFKNKIAVTKFMDESFDDVGKKEVSEVLRECAECFVLTRSPKKGGCWGDDTEVIEDALKVCQSVVVDPPVQEAPEEEIVEEQDDKPKEKKVKQAKKKAKPVQKASPRKKVTKVAAKKATKKTGTKMATKTKKATPVKKATKTAKKTKKTQPKKPISAVASDDKFAKILNTTRFSEESLKGLKGLELWVGAARLLKLKSKIRCQLQDMPLVVGHLFDVHRGKAKLNEEGFEGKGEKSYRKKRLLNILSAIKVQLKLT